MTIKIKPWQFKDAVTGLSIKIIEGKVLNRIHMDMPSKTPQVKNRDFYFTKDGDFDGTGSAKKND